MAYTVLKIIEHTAQNIGLIAYGEAVDPNISNTIMNELNFMLSNWSITYNNYGLYEKIIPSKDAIKIGTSGTSDTTFDIEERPAVIDLVQYINGSIIQNLVTRTYSEYTTKTFSNGGTPRFAYIRNDFPYDYIYFDTIPSGGQIRIIGKPYYKEYTRFDDEVLLPPEYIQALILNLVLRVAPLFGIEVTQNMVIAASSSMKHIKRMNAMNIAIQPRNDFGSMFRTNGSFNIYRG